MVQVLPGGAGFAHFFELFELEYREKSFDYGLITIGWQVARFVEYLRLKGD
jgi:hypothetical protein